MISVCTCGPVTDATNFEKNLPVTVEGSPELLVEPKLTAVSRLHRNNGPKRGPTFENNVRPRRLHQNALIKMCLDGHSDVPHDCLPPVRLFDRLTAKPTRPSVRQIARPNFLSPDRPPDLFPRPFGTTMAHSGWSKKSPGRTKTGPAWTKLGLQRKQN